MQHNKRYQQMRAKRRGRKDPTVQGVGFDLPTQYHDLEFPSQKYRIRQGVLNDRHRQKSTILQLEKMKVLFQFTQLASTHGLINWPRFYAEAITWSWVGGKPLGAS